MSSADQIYLYLCDALYKVNIKLCVHVNFSGTINPVSVDDFKDHVQKMHSNDDYLFSEEYSVSFGFLSDD